MINRTKWFIQDWIATIQAMCDKEFMDSLKRKVNKEDYIPLEK